LKTASDKLLHRLDSLKTDCKLESIVPERKRPKILRLYEPEIEDK
jgi:hypothetical protein